ncbi:DNA-binding transcriptional MocR family regulator [Mesorhizobium soli]|uniref:aminotransferase-like domain-containing protein n=1 Tax=Pseudaminobacter soli (ex Li et al. 2025) TaxID=1295366 RepID=UPI0024765375|nr:PLP-dependent aminotransferase family protein [Mesorhizobium soli]MDH6234574.1 DNA-binding transcriptional MocR family regulator [Mesorhizobium soli]
MKIYERLAAELATAIREGRFPSGFALPPIREFARQRGIGHSTAARVYGDLRLQGLVTGEVGRGTFVRERPRELGPLSAEVRYTAKARLAEGITPQNLRTALKAVSALPNVERLTAQISPLGNLVLRRALSHYLAAQGLDVVPSRIFATNGGLAAMRLAILSAGLARGQRVAVDAATYPGLKLVASQLGLELEPLPFDLNGPIPSHLEELLSKKRVSAIHTIPTAHLPLGWVMPIQRRREIVELARAHDVTLFEDVTYNHLVSGAPPALCDLAPERTWAIGSLSGLLGDGLRFGYVVAPQPQGGGLEKTALSWGLAAPPLICELIRLWLEGGIVRSIQVAQTDHAELVWDHISKSGLQGLSPSAAGWCLWLPVGRGYRCEEIASELRSEGIDAVSSEPFTIAPQKPNALAVRLRSIAPEDMEKGIHLILRVCA